MPTYHPPAAPPEFGTGLRGRLARNPHPASRAELAAWRTLRITRVLPDESISQRRPGSRFRWV